MPARALLRWLAPFVLMAVIFVLSAQPNLSSGLGLIDLIGRKLVHAGTYALLCWLWWRALQPSLPARTALLTSLAISAAYGASDEFHQSFVATRHGTPVDVAIDALGASLAAALVWRSRAARACRGDQAGRSAAPEGAG